MPVTNALDTVFILQFFGVSSDGSKDFDVGRLVGDGDVSIDPDKVSTSTAVLGVHADFGPDYCGAVVVLAVNASGSSGVPVAVGVNADGDSDTDRLAFHCDHHGSQRSSSS